MADERELNELYKERAELLRTVEKTNKRIKRLREENLATEKEISAIAIEAEIALAKAQDLQSKINEERGRRLIEEEQSLSSIGSIYSDLVDSERVRLQLTRQQTFSDIEQLDTVTQVATITRDIAQLNQDDIIAQQELSDQFFNRIDLLEQDEDINQELVDHLKEQFHLAQQLTNTTEDQVRASSRLTSVFDGLRDTASGLLQTASDIFTSMGGLVGGVVIGLGAVADNVTEVNRELGIGITNLSELNLSAGALSLVFSESTAAARSLSNQLGSTAEATSQTQINTNLIAETMGVSAEEAGTLIGQFSRLNEGSSSVAADMIATTREFAMQRNVIPADVLGDLANNAEAFALYAKDGGTNLVEAATFARQLGTSFETLTGIAENLLDFENSINQELQLSAMLGRNINLDRARALAFQGEIEEATKATLDALGGVVAFERMNVFEKQETAKLLGISVGELQKMVNNQDKITTQGEMIRQKFSAWNETINTFANKTLGITLQGLGGMLVMAGDLGQGFRAIGGMLARIKNLTFVTQAAEKISLGYQKVKTALLGKQLAISKQMNRQPSIPTDRQPGNVGGIGKINPGALVKGAAAMALVAGSLFILAKAFQEFAEVEWDNINWSNIVAGMTSMAVLTGIAAALGAAAPAILTGAAAMAAVAGSIFILAKAFQAFASGAQVLSEIHPTISLMIGQVDGIMKLTGALFSLSGGLAAVGAASLFALPAITGVSLVTGLLTTTADALGLSDEESDGTNQMLEEIRGLRKDLREGRIAVYLDGDKVSQSVVKSMNESRMNSIGL